MNKWKIVSYYTPNYKEIAYTHLIPSLEKLGLPHIVKEIPTINWKMATDFKPTFIKECLSTIIEDVIWIDCDAIVNSYPELFDTIPLEFDLAVHYFDPTVFYTNSGRPIHVASGTVYIQNNTNVLSLINDWIELTQKNSLEQMALQQAIEKNENKVLALPREYCYITTQPNGQLPRIIIENPIISHFQASRKMRNR